MALVPSILDWSFFWILDLQNEYMPELRQVHSRLYNGLACDVFDFKTLYASNEQPRRKHTSLAG
jgi:hypothetical protein